MVGLRYSKSSPSFVGLLSCRLADGARPVRELTVLRSHTSERGTAVLRSLPTRAKLGVGLERSSWFESASALDTGRIYCFEKNCDIVDLQSKVFDLAAMYPSHPTNADAYGGVTIQQKLSELRRATKLSDCGRGTPRPYDWGALRANSYRLADGARPVPTIGGRSVKHNDSEPRGLAVI